MWAKSMGLSLRGEKAYSLVRGLLEAVTCLVRVSCPPPAPKLQKAKYPGHVSQLHFINRKHIASLEGPKDTFI